MKCTRFGVLLIGVLIAASAAAAPRQSRTYPGSFLNRTVSSVTQLVDQISRDKQVAARYERHFGRPASVLTQYFKRNLRLVKLTRARTVVVYSLDRHGRVVSRKQVLRKGCSVFVTTDRKLILKGSCGNPLLGELPGGPLAQKSVQPPAKPAAAPQAAPPPAEEPAKELVEKIAEETVPAPQPELPKSPAAEPVQPEPSPQVPEAPQPVAESLPQAPNPPAETPVVSTSNNRKWLLPLLLLGAGAAVVHGGDGDDEREPPLPKPIPEPSSSLALGSGLAALAGGTLARRRKR